MDDATPPNAPRKRTKGDLVQIFETQPRGQQGQDHHRQHVLVKVPLDRREISAAPPNS
jgi:hypothetical protein